MNWFSIITFSIVIICIYRQIGMHVDHFSWTGTDWNTATHEWIMISSHAFVISDPRPQRHVTYRSYRPYQHPKRNRVMYRLCGGSDRPTDRTNRALRHASATKQKQTDKRTDHHPVIKLYMYLPPHSQCEQNSSHACFSALHAIAHARARFNQRQAIAARRRAWLLVYHLAGG